jgi:hypothetical protein
MKLKALNCPGGRIYMLRWLVIKVITHRSFSALLFGLVTAGMSAAYGSNETLSHLRLLRSVGAGCISSL